MLPADEALIRAIDAGVAAKNIPAGSLGRLFELAKSIARIQHTPHPLVDSCAIVVFAGDHGVASEELGGHQGQSTRQLVETAVAGGAAISVLCRVNQLHLRVVDAGVNHTFGARPGLIDAKIAPGTANFARAQAMSVEQVAEAITVGRGVVRQCVQDTGCQAIGFGDMGIGGSASAAALTARLLDLRVEACVARGAGLDDRLVTQQRAVLTRALALHDQARAPRELLAAFGGYEIAMMTGAMMQAAAMQRVVVVDGFVPTAAMLVARAIDAGVVRSCVFAHRSAEAGHRFALAALGATPLLEFDMFLGEGCAAALVMPMLRSAARLLTEMPGASEPGRP